MLQMIDYGLAVAFVAQYSGQQAMVCDLSSENQRIREENVVINVAGNVVTNEDKVLALLRQDGKLTARVLVSTLGLTQRQVQRILAGLKAEKKIRRHGARKNGYWEVMD